MAVIAVPCPECGSTEVVRDGRQAHGAQFVTSQGVHLSEVSNHDTRTI
jgi:hypothetical protein